MLTCYEFMFMTLSFAIATSLSFLLQRLVNPALLVLWHHRASLNLSGSKCSIFTARRICNACA